MPKKVLLFTPGLDSRLSLWKLRSEGKEKDYTLCYVDVGSKYSDVEIFLLRQFYNENFVTIIKGPKLSKFEDSWTSYIPNRNAIVAVLAQTCLDADELYFSSVRDDSVSDGTKKFRLALSKLLSVSTGRNIKVDSILKSKDKVSWVLEYRKTCESNRLDLLTHTYSCYSPYLKTNTLQYLYKRGGSLRMSSSNVTFYGCRACKACFRKFVALSAANIYIPMNISKGIPVIQEYVNKYLNTDSDILTPKVVAIIDYLETFDYHTIQV